MKILENYYYKLDNDKDVSIVWKKHDKACVLELGTTYPTAIVDIDRLSGMPTTKEKLNQLGYLEESENEFFLKYNDYSRYSVCTNDNFYGWFFCDEEKNLRDFQFVHELQILQFALTNKELILKP
jgi:hypothetical protein